MGALRLTSRRWALPLRHCADAPYMQRVRMTDVIDNCQPAPLQGMTLLTNLDTSHNIFSEIGCWFCNGTLAVCRQGCAPCNQRIPCPDLGTLLRQTRAMLSHRR